jgi:hypothetical protein
MLTASNALTPERTVVAEYLLGVLTAARGSADARAHAATLDAMTDSTFAPHELAAVVRCVAAFHDGRCVETLAELDRARPRFWLGVVASAALANNGLERLVRSQCLARTGKPREAIAWYATIEQNTLYDLALRMPALRGKASAFRALGDQRSADDIERRITAW